MTRPKANPDSARPCKALQGRGPASQLRRSHFFHQEAHDQCRSAGNDIRMAIQEELLGSSWILLVLRGRLWQTPTGWSEHSRRVNDSEPFKMNHGIAAFWRYALVIICMASGSARWWIIKFAAWTSARCWSLVCTGCWFASFQTFQTFPCTLFRAFLRGALKASFPCQSKGYCMWWRISFEHQPMRNAFKIIQRLDVPPQIFLSSFTEGGQRLLKPRMNCIVGKVLVWAILGRILATWLHLVATEVPWSMWCSLFLHH